MKRNTIANAVELFERYKRTKEPELLDSAISILEEVEKKDSGSLNLLGLCYLEKGDVRKAIEVFNEAYKRAKDEESRGVILLNKAMALMKLREYQGAYDALKEAISLRTSVKGEAKRLLAKVCLARGGKYVEEAKDILESFEIPNEDLAVAYILLARRGRKEYGKKAIEVSKFLKDDRLLAEALLSSGEEKDVEEALELFRRVRDVRGEARALLVLSKYKPELVYEAASKLEEIEDESQEHLQLLYEVYKRTGLVELLKRAITIAEKLKDSLFLARAYVELSKVENEVENLRLAVKYYEEYVRRAEGK
ncbi:MAG: hypothetical protein ASUL_02484 [Candidatus Aramenus sulfurataquae]|uniref:Tetratricopeptide repeat protein n=2 Tax=Candidatus Aramenus sulfurataquae TaxID=1326980 RepID=W7L827_9CREN|nr:MAG: hypothetical protein ASUL_02484 [Candidatus Aramenus sulfurataquae]MCL7344149.1 tetratricopeptide repeat protein [Candidatus Aramenus sulfurataquae]